MAIGGRSRGRARTCRGIREGLHSSTAAGEPGISQESLGSVPIIQNEQIVLEARVGVGIVSGVQIHQVYFQQAKSPVAREHSYLEQLQRYKHPTFSSTLVPSEAEAWFKSIEKTLDAMKCSDNQRVTLATYLFMGEVDHWWETAKRTIMETPILWASFQDRFFDQYFPQSYRNACISEFYMLEQGDMSISRYDTRFNEFSHYI
ncbi:hypothetical protein GIB67_005028, partial [Kingdonia uniflora]